MREGLVLQIGIGLAPEGPPFGPLAALGALRQAPAQALEFQCRRAGGRAMSGLRARRGERAGPLHVGRGHACEGISRLAVVRHQVFDQRNRHQAAVGRQRVSPERLVEDRHAVGKAAERHVGIPSIAEVVIFARIEFQPLRRVLVRQLEAARQHHRAGHGVMAPAVAFVQSQGGLGMGDVVLQAGAVIARQQQVALVAEGDGEAGLGGGRFRLQFQRAGETGLCLAQVGRAALFQTAVASQAPIVGGEVIGGQSSATPMLCRLDLYRQAAGDRQGDLGFDIENVGERAIVTRRPEERAGLSLDQFGRETEPVALHSHAALENVVDAELARDDRRIEDALVQRHAGASARHQQIVAPRQVVLDIGGDAVADMVAVFGSEGGEGHDRDRGGRRRRRAIGAEVSHQGEGWRRHFRRRHAVARRPGRRQGADQRRLVADLELSVDRRQVVSDGRGRNVVPGRDLLVGVALGVAFRDGQFTFGKTHATPQGR